MCSSPINNGGDPHIHHLGSSSSANVPQNIQNDIVNMGTTAEAMVNTLKDIAAGKYSDANQAQDAWDNVSPAFSESLGQLGIDLDKMPKSPQQQKLKDLQGTLNEIGLDIDQDMYNGSYSKAAAQSNLNFWNKGSGPIPSGPQTLQDILKAAYPKQ